MARRAKVFDPSLNLPYSAGSAQVGMTPLVEISFQVEGPTSLEERTAYLNIDHALKLLGDLAIAVETCRKLEREEKGLRRK